jgi:uncharacterized protein (DUF2141 family)
MIKSILSVVLCIATCMGAAYADQDGSTVANLKVAVTGARNNNGVVRVALYNSKDAYDADKDNSGKGAVRREAVPINNGRAEALFNGLSYGTYAIKVFHDEDNSGKFVTGMFGIPKLQYGFSNNAKGAFGPASFDKAAFQLKSAQEDTTIKLSN